ncbi:MAG TPA: radical SAM protein [Paludibacteraceae bacterium]|nr:radical SAM protein [Paludibacteraceae bacterium]HQF51264.1 radical SAM protein [Paludibacteraceae bacterium]
MLRLTFQYFIAKINKQGRLSAMPFSISVEPTNCCNLSCPECITGSGRLKRKKGALSFTDFSRLMDEVSPDLIHLFLYFQGEPMLNADFVKMVRYAKSKGLFVATSTNGHFLTDRMCEELVHSGIDHVIISLDGVQSSSYSVYRRQGDFERVKNGISRLVETRKRSSRYPLIELQFVVFRHNESEIDDFKSLAKSLGVDFATLKSAQIYNLDSPSSEILPPLNEKYSRYEKVGSHYRLKTKKHKSCWRQWSACIVTCDGLVSPCCYDKEAEMAYGNAFASGFKSCWFSGNALALRKQLMLGKRYAICKDCPE